MRMQHRAILMRPTDGTGRTREATIGALKEGVRDGGLCWVPSFGNGPAAGRHEHFPLLVAAGKGHVDLVLEIMNFANARSEGATSNSRPAKRTCTTRSY
jgi:hypothetical protein